MDDKSLIMAVKGGDTDAFALLVKAYEKQVYNLCLRMVGDPTDAEDLAQEAFVKSWQGLEFYKFEAAFSTWLYRLTTNLCIDFLRKKKRRPTLSLILEDEEGETRLDVPDPRPQPEETVLQKERQEALNRAMAQLDDEARAILTLRVVDELSYEELAKALDLNVGTVKSRLARARTKLRKILLKEGNIFRLGASKSPEREDV